MKTNHFKLRLSEGRPDDATEAIQEKIIEQAQKELEGITDPERLLEQRQALRDKKEMLQAQIKRMKTQNTKTNKQREAMFHQWDMFKAGVLELARKHGIDFKQLPNTAIGRTFISKIQNSNPEHFVTVEGKRIPQKRVDVLFDEELIRLFEVEVRQQLLEDIIAKKSRALKALFDSDRE